MSMSNPNNAVMRLRAQLEPCLQSMHPRVLMDLIGSLAAGIWSNLEAEGQPLPKVMAGLTGLTGDALEAIITKVSLCDFKNRCLTHVWRVRGLQSVMEMVKCHDTELLQTMVREKHSAVFVFSHFGPRYAVAPAFQQAGIPVAMFQGILPPPLKREDVERFASQLPGMEYYWINDPSVNRAVHLKRAVERLQRGGLVATAIDGGHGDALIDADFLGYRIQVGRGAAVLTRMTGVPLIPITVTWGDDWSIDFRIHSAIPRPDIPPQDHAAFDKALIDQTVRFFESYIRTAPEQLRLDRLARLITRPKVA